MAQGDDAGARKRSDVHDGLGLEALGVAQSIGKNEASFCIGIENLDGLARHARDDVARFGGRPSRHVLAGGDQPDDVQFEAELRRGAQGSQHARRAAHVELHLVQIGRWLDGNAAGIECNALSHEYHGSILPAGAGVAEDHELGRLVRSLRNREQRAHPEFLHVFLLEHFHRQLPFTPELYRGVSEVRGRAHVRGQIAEVPGERHASGDGASFARPALQGGGIALGNGRNRHMSERRRFRLLALHAIEAVDDVGRRQHELTGFPSGIAAGNFQLCEIQGRIACPRFLNGGKRRARAVAILLLAEFLLPPQAHEQHALCGDTANAIQQPGGSHLAVHVPGSEKLANLAVRRLIQRIRRPRQLARFEYTCSDARDRVFLRHREFCVKFHSAWTRGTCKDYLRFASLKSKQHGVFPLRSNMLR